MVPDMARPKYKKSTIRLGMRGRDAVWRGGVGDSQGEHFTGIHSQSISQRSSFISLQRKRKDTKDNGILPWTKQAQICIWNFDLVFEPLSWRKIVYTTNQENQLKSPSIQIKKDDGIHLQAHRGWTSLNGIGSELIKFSDWSSLFIVTVGFVYSR